VATTEDSTSQTRIQALQQFVLQLQIRVAALEAALAAAQQNQSQIWGSGN
jgi:hypothetical protein